MLATLPPPEPEQNAIMHASRLALAALALMASLPFLIPLHTTPIPSFRAEWLAASLGLAAAAALIGARRLPLPGAALLAMTFAGIALAQNAFGLAPVPQLATLFALYLVWAAMLACTGRLLAEQLGMARLVHVMASAILIGSLLAALLGFAQPWLAPLGWPGYALRSGGALGQGNHLNVYLWLGLASALYLRMTGRMPRAGFWFAAVVLALAAVLIGQRSAFLYAVTLIAVAAWQWRSDGPGAPDGRRLALGIGLLFVLLQPLGALLPSGSGGAAAPPAMRAMTEFKGPSIRLQLLDLGYRAIAAAPLAGAGIGAYPGLAYKHADSIDPADNPGPAEHAHNLLVDIAAELGVPAAMLLAVAALLWLRRLPQRASSAEAGWSAAVVGMLASHSMIEYPLWHAHFLGPLAFIVGAFGSGRRFGSRASAAVLAGALVASGAWTLHELRRDYVRLELALGTGITQPTAKAALLGIPQASLLAPWVQTTACVSLDPLRVSLADGLTVCNAAMAFAPTPETGVNIAVLLLREGRTTAAEDLLRRTRRASPNRNIGALLDPLVAQDERIQVLRSVGSAR